MLLYLYEAADCFSLCASTFGYYRSHLLQYNTMSEEGSSTSRNSDSDFRLTETTDKCLGTNCLDASADNSQEGNVETSDVVAPQNAMNGNVYQVSQVSRKNIPDKESFQRINYLLQASQMIIARSPRARSVPAYYCSLIHNIAQKSLIRLHPNVKRMMCRGCKCLLFPGINAHVTVKSKPMCQVLWTCFLCGTIRRLPAKRGYELWVQKPEALVLP